MTLVQTSGDGGADRSLSPVEATQAALDAIERHDSQVNAFVLVTAETALAQAKESEERWRDGRALGPADGVPTSIKDIFLTRDWPTRYFSFDANDLQTPSHGYEKSDGPGRLDLIIDLALFYGRNNLLLNGDQGWVPGNVFGTVVEGLKEMAEACQDIWMGGARGETLTFTRLRED